MARADESVVRFVAGWPSHARMEWLLAGGSARTRTVVVRKMGSWLAKRERLGGGQEGSRGWGEKPTAEGQRSLEGRQVEKIRGVRDEVAKEAQVVWLRMGKERRAKMTKSKPRRGSTRRGRQRWRGRRPVPVRRQRRRRRPWTASLEFEVLGYRVPH